MSPTTTRARVRSALRFRRRNIAIGGAVVLLAAAGWLLLRDPGSGRPADAPARSTAMPAGDMGGMEMGGMDMSGDGTVRLTSGQLREFGISFSTAEVRPLTTEVRTTGLVTFDETRLVNFAPKFGGFVERLYVNFTGQPVQRGQPLLEIYSPELVAAQQELLVARELDRTMGESSVPGVQPRGTSLLAAARQRLRLWDMTDAQISGVLRTGRVRRAITLYSPAGGTVVEKNVIDGQAVMAGQTIYTIADLRSVWVDAELREPDVANVRVGSGADVELNAYPGRTFKGRISYLYPTVQEAARTV
ncbi:MAG: efflux RND transporter periplasmic adaptor subunit, partial [Gemmatimonadaceae bacterium]